MRSSNQKYGEDLEKFRDLAAAKTAEQEARDRELAEAVFTRAARHKRIAERAIRTDLHLKKAIGDVGRLVADAAKLGAHLDVCFCIDGTGSMKNCIFGVKSCIVAAQVSFGHCAEREADCTKYSDI